MSNSRIAKNTLSLYVRMFLTMGISLYTSRIVLKSLGAEDFGIYNIVGGFVVLITFMNSTLSAAASRFFAYEIGKSENSNLERIFRSAIATHLIYAFLMVVFLETFGLWFLKYKLVIPPERFSAAVWVFHFSVTGAFIAILQTPLSSLIIATERMKVFAYLGIFDAVNKLAVAAVLVLTNKDKLVMYSVLLALSQIVIFSVNHIYCKKKFVSYNLKPLIDIPLQKSILGYTGWSIIGSSAFILKTQGVNILLNLFFGPSVNAARGIAFQVNTIINRFAQNFTMAMNPQIVKMYAAGNIQGMTNLIGRGAKFSFYLLFLLALPLLFQTKFLLSVWLVEVPPYTLIFTKLLIITSLIDSFAYAMTASIQATGDIKKYQLVIGGTQLLNLPISYFLLKAGHSPVITFYVSILIAAITVFLRIVVIKNKIPLFPVKQFLFSVLGVSCAVVVLSVIPPFLLNNVVKKAWPNFIFSSFTCVFSTLLSIWIFGLNQLEKNWLYSSVKKLYVK